MSRRKRRKPVRRPVRPKREPQAALEPGIAPEPPRIAPDASEPIDPPSGSPETETRQNGSTAISEAGALVYTVPELAEALRVSRSTIDRLKLPGRVRIGGQVRYLRSAIVAWLESQASAE